MFLINRIGKNPKQFSTHSFRRGGASWAFSSEISSELIFFLEQSYSERKLSLLSINSLSNGMSIIPKREILSF
jgi:hypothetical protein